MLWIHKNIKTEQVPVQSAGLTAVMLHLFDRSVLMMSVYVEGNNSETLLGAIYKLHRLHETHNKIDIQTDVIPTGNFNRHDQLWKENDVSSTFAKCDTCTTVH
jgi:hypothetical protein